MQLPIVQIGVGTARPESRVLGSGLFRFAPREIPSDSGSRRGSCVGHVGQSWMTVRSDGFPSIGGVVSDKAFRETGNRRARRIANRSRGFTAASQEHRPPELIAHKCFTTSTPLACGMAGGLCRTCRTDLDDRAQRWIRKHRGGLCRTKFFVRGEIGERYGSRMGAAGSLLGDDLGLGTYDR